MEPCVCFVKARHLDSERIPAYLHVSWCSVFKTAIKFILLENVEQVNRESTNSLIDAVTDGLLD